MIGYDTGEMANLQLVCLHAHICYNLQLVCLHICYIGKTVSCQFYKRQTELGLPHILGVASPQDLLFIIQPLHNLPATMTITISDGVATHS